MTQSIVVQVGQCGNQVGCRFWDLALREHAHVNKVGLYDEALSSFFRNVDPRKSGGGACYVGGRIQHLKARVKTTFLSVSGEFQVQQQQSGRKVKACRFTQNKIIKTKTCRVWKKNTIIKNINRVHKKAQYLYGCFCMKGTDVTLGVLSLLKEEFPDVCRIVTAMYPSAEDDVITSPYNSVLAMRELTEHADCVLPVENQSLVDIVNKISLMSHNAKPGCVLKKESTVTSGQGGVSPTERPFDAMNNIVANLLLNITSEVTRRP
uniref:Tubulin epsilon 1 n=1 Tax=Xiphophorus couchianus TaxID=32473 RepID=A0A3B5L772_9TELE